MAGDRNGQSGRIGETLPISGVPHRASPSSARTDVQRASSLLSVVLALGASLLIGKDIAGRDVSHDLVHGEDVVDAGRVVGFGTVLEPCMCPLGPSKSGILPP